MITSINDRGSPDRQDSHDGQLWRKTKASVRVNGKLYDNRLSITGATYGEAVFFISFTDTASSLRILR